ncbi:MAG TPA: hypothetical protein VJ780_06230 [Flavobacterium sp.]|nr:hypothetical protein [Flavobacterium sp.]
MKDLGITKGDWIKNGKNGIHNELGENICVTNPLSEKCITDADFIANAGTTANKCGLLPSELLEQRDEMLEALRSISHAYDMDNFSYLNFNEIKQLIKKATE